MIKRQLNKVFDSYSSAFSECSVTEQHYPPSDAAAECLAFCLRSRFYLILRVFVFWIVKYTHYAPMRESIHEIASKEQSRTESQVRAVIQGIACPCGRLKQPSLLSFSLHMQFTILYFVLICSIQACHHGIYQSWPTRM